MSGGESDLAVEAMLRNMLQEITWRRENPAQHVSEIKSSKKKKKAKSKKSSKEKKNKTKNGKSKRRVKIQDPDEMSLQSEVTFHTETTAPLTPRPSTSSNIINEKKKKSKSKKSPTDKIKKKKEKKLTPDETVERDNSSYSTIPRNILVEGRDRRVLRPAKSDYIPRNKTTVDERSPRTPFRRQMSLPARRPPLPAAPSDFKNAKWDMSSTEFYRGVVQTINSPKHLVTEVHPEDIERMVCQALVRLG